MYRVYGFIEFMDVKSLWMYRVYGCIEFMDV